MNDRAATKSPWAAFVSDTVGSSTWYVAPRQKQNVAGVFIPRRQWTELRREFQRVHGCDPYDVPPPGHPHAATEVAA